MKRYPVVILACLVLSAAAQSQEQAEKVWHFAVSGDSRNCGDVVMPAIAQSARQNHARFYWHLGDFRAMYGLDEDMHQLYGDSLSKSENKPEYHNIAWGDFLAHQVAPFSPLPVRLGIGNHELIGKTGDDYVNTFGYWLDTPELRQQRLDDAKSEDSKIDPPIQLYYHWKQNGVDFIYMDNSGDDGFDETQMKWFEGILSHDKTDDSVKTVVAAMHRALPNSLACGHSMNGDRENPSSKGTESGRRAYTDLLRWKKDTQDRKHVYLLASHSHFYMSDLYDTDYWNNPAHGGEVLPGWIVGTAGAQRYALPDLSDEQKRKTDARNDIWGYLLASVNPSGVIRFRFVELGKKDLPLDVRDRYGRKFVNFCYADNKNDKSHPPPPTCLEK